MQCEMREFKAILKGKMLIHLFLKCLLISVKIEGLTSHKGSLVPKADSLLIHLHTNSVNIYHGPRECLSL